MNEDKARERGSVYWARIDGNWEPVRYGWERYNYSDGFMDEVFHRLGDGYACYVSNYEGFEWAGKVEAPKELINAPAN